MSSSSKQVVRMGDNLWWIAGKPGEDIKKFDYEPCLNCYGRLVEERFTKNEYIYYKNKQDLYKHVGYGKCANGCGYIVVRQFYVKTISYDELVNHNLNCPFDKITNFIVK